MKTIIYITLKHGNEAEDTDNLLITGIEAESLGGAEHVILDAHPQVIGALAFEVGKGTATEYFNSLLAETKVMSCDEFSIRIARMVARVEERMNNLLDEKKEIEARIKDLEKEIATLQEYIRDAEADMEDLKKGYAIPVRYQYPEKIQKAYDAYNSFVGEN